MVDKWGDWVHNYTVGTNKKYIRIGLTIVPYVFSDRIDFYLGVDFEATYSINDDNNLWAVSGDWTRASATVAGSGIQTPSGGGTQVLWSEAVESGHLYRVYGSPGETKTATAGASIRNLFSFNNTATVTYSESATIPAIIPEAPATVTSTPGNGIVSIGYTAPGYDGGAAITKYQYTTNGGTTWTDTPSSNPFNVSGTNGTAITVSVRAVNSAGNGASRGATSTPRTVPGAPTSFTANGATFGQLGLSWAAPSSNGGAAISGYTLIRTSPGTATTLLTNSNQTTYTDSSLLPYTDYTYTVAAVNVAGTGATTTVTQKTLGGIAKIWNGINWITTLPKVWNGLNWVDAQARMYDGVGATEDAKWKHGI
jgi:hypothetical protein